MTTLPATGYFTNAARTNAEAKTAQDDMLEVTREQPGGAAEQSLTISSGAVTPAAGAARAIKLAGEGAADDILDNIVLTNIPTGALMMLRGNGTDEITLNHGAGGSGQMLLRDAVDYLLDTDAKRIAFMVVGTDLLEIWRSHGKLPEFSAETATTSGSTSVISGIGPNARRITCFLDDVSHNSTGDIFLKLGDSGGIETGGYKQGNSSFNAFTVNTLNLNSDSQGRIVLELIDPSTDLWGFNSVFQGNTAAGTKSLTGGPITQLELSTGATFNGGGWRIRVEE